MVLPRVRRSFLLCVLLLGHALFSTVPPLYGVKLSAIQSCAGTCGEVRQLPCSCDMKCPVYKNCCEDFYDECPHILKASKEVYRKQMLANVVCMSSTFTITNCVDESEEIESTTHTSQRDNSMSIESSTPAGCCDNNTGNTNNLHITGTKPSIDDKEKDSSYTKTKMYSGNEGKDSLNTKMKMYTGNGENDSPKIETNMYTGTGDEHSTYTEPKLIDVIQSAQVTDTDTGFVYLNMHVFRCFASNTSSPVMWDTQVGMVKMNSPTSLNEFAKQIDPFETPRYTPPLRAEGSNIEAYCIDHSHGYLQLYNMYIDSCESTQLETPVNPEWSQKCEEFFSYVHTIDGSGFWYFKNRFCALCHFGPDAVIEPVTNPALSRHSYNFPVVVSLVNEKLQLSNTLQLPDLSWVEAVCNVTPSLKQVAVNGCKAISCSENFVMRPTGTCEKVIIAHFAFHEDEFPLDSTQLQHFQYFFLCHLKQLLDLVPTVNDEHQAFIFLDLKENRLLYGLTFQYYNTATLDVDWRGPLNLLRQLVKAAKIFKYYRQEQSCRSHSNSIECELKSAPKRSRTPRQNVRSFNFYDVYNGDNPFHDQDKEIENMNVSLCFCSTQSVPQICVFGCIYQYLNTSDTSLSNDLCLDEYKTRLQKAASDAVLVTTWFTWSVLLATSLYLIFLADLAELTK